MRICSLVLMLLTAHEAAAAFQKSSAVRVDDLTRLGYQRTLDGSAVLPLFDLKDRGDPFVTATDFTSVNAFVVAPFSTSLRTDSRSRSLIRADARRDPGSFVATTVIKQRPVVASLSTALGPSWKLKAFVTAVLAAFVAMLIAEAFKSKIKDREASVRASNFDVAMALAVVIAGPIVGLVALLGVHIVMGFATWTWLDLPVNLVIASGISGYVVYKNLIWNVRGVDPSGKKSENSK